MPYKSAAQRGKFHVLEREGKISPAVVNEFDQASKGMKLPRHVGDRHSMKALKHHAKRK